MNSRTIDIAHALENLPPNIRQAVEDFDWGTEVLGIAREYGIQVDEIDVFQRETMLIIVGLERAQDYQHNLVQHMGISRSLAEQLVQEANERIFEELQKRAFSKEQKSIKNEGYSNQGDDNDIHHEIRNEMRSHGIELINHDDDGETSSSLENHEESRDTQSFNSFETKYEDGDNFGGSSEPLNNLNSVTPPQSDSSYSHRNNYLEELSDDDYRGIGGHRIHVEVSKQEQKVSSEEDISLLEPSDNKKVVSQDLDSELFHSPKISRHDSLDFSPQEQDQVKEDGEFLRHIKNNITQEDQK